MKPVVVSVVMPVYNTQRYLARAIESILGQTLQEFELIIIDDGSTDRSKQILEAYARRDGRIRLISRENKGISYTRNEGVNLAQSELIAVMDSDDIAHSHRLEMQCEYMSRHADCVALGSRVELIDAEGNAIREWSSEIEHAEIESAHLDGRSGAMCNPVTIVRREALQGVGGYDEELAGAEDFDLFLKLGEIGLLHNLPMVLLKYRQHVNSFGYDNRILQRQRMEIALRRAYARRGLKTPEHLRYRLNARSLGEIHRKWAWWALRAGNVATARKHALASLGTEPFSKQSWKSFVCAIRGY